MFVDLVGSTALATRLDPEDLRELIGAFHARVAGTVGRFGGYVAQYLGDGVLTYFGYPRAEEDDAERAIRAGLELIGGDAGARPAAGRPDARAGRDRDRARGRRRPDRRRPAHEQTVVGETPNLAARLQALAEPDSVVIDAATQRLVGNLFE